MQGKSVQIEVKDISTPASGEQLITQSLYASQAIKPKEKEACGCPSPPRTYGMLLESTTHLLGM